jgi:hypothetical protein
MSDARLQVLVNDLVRCVREHGAPGMPDVRVQNGKVIVPDENSVDTATKQNVDAAMQACKTVKDRIPPAAMSDTGGSGANGRRGPTAADVPKLRQYARCVRENGVPDWPDPRADGSFPLHGSPIETEGKSPRVVAAMQACKKYWSEGLRFS